MLRSTFFSLLLMAGFSVQAAVVEQCEFENTLSDLELAGQVTVTKVHNKLMAEMVIKGQNEIFKTEDIEMKTYPKANLKDAIEKTNLKSIAAALKVSFKGVKSITITTVGVQAFQDDGAGAQIYRLMDAKGKVLAKLAQVGWGAVRCK